MGTGGSKHEIHRLTLEYVTGSSKYMAVGLTLPRLLDDQETCLTETAERTDLTAVTYLKRKGVAERASRGVWRLIVSEPSTDADSPAVGAGLSVIPIPEPEGGETDAASASDRQDHLSRWHDRNGDHSSVMEG